MNPPKILITNKVSQCGVDRLKEAGFEIVWSKSSAVEDVKKVIGECDGIIARMTPVRKEMIESAPNLKIIGMHGVGLDGIDVEYATEKGIAVTHAPAANCVSVAEHVMTSILCLAKKTIPADYALRVENRFRDRDKFLGCDIEGKVLGIVGLGKIGRQVAQRASLGFDMKVIAYDPYVSADQMKNIGAGVEKVKSMEEVMRRSDFVSFHTLLTPELVGVVNYDMLKQMKPTAYFINEMRGALVNEEDLYRALEEGIIAGAALDVFVQEPTPDNYKLLKAPNLIATPHIAASTTESMDRMVLTVVEDFIRFFRNEEIAFLANPNYKNNTV